MPVKEQADYNDLSWELCVCKVKQCRRVSKWPDALNDTESEFS